MKFFRCNLDSNTRLQMKYLYTSLVAIKIDQLWKIKNLKKPKIFYIDFFP